MAMIFDPNFGAQFDKKFPVFMNWSNTTDKI